MYGDFCAAFKRVETAEKELVMNKAYLGACVGLLFASTTLATVSLSNVSIAQREGSKRVDIFYEISATASVSVTIPNAQEASFSGDLGS